MYILYYQLQDTREYIVEYDIISMYGVPVSFSYRSTKNDTYAQQFTREEVVNIMRLDKKIQFERVDKVQNIF